MESWYQGAFMGVHTWGGVVHVERCTHICTHVHGCACMYVCLYMLQCVCVCVCACVYGHTKVCANLGVEVGLWGCLPMGVHR